MKGVNWDMVGGIAGVVGVVIAIILGWDQLTSRLNRPNILRLFRSVTAPIIQSLVKIWHLIRRNWRRLAILMMPIVSLISFNRAFGDWLQAISAFFAVLSLLAAMYLTIGRGVRAERRKTLVHDQGVLSRNINYRHIRCNKSVTIDAMTTFNGELLAATRENRLFKGSPDNSILSWDFLEQTPGIVAMAATNKTLFTVSKSQIFQRWSLSSIRAGWVDIERVDESITAMTAVNDRLFAATESHKLLTCDLSVSASWNHIGHAQNVVEMFTINHEIFAISENRMLWKKRVPVLPDKSWNLIGHVHDIIGHLGGNTKVAVIGDRLFVTGDGNRLFAVNLLAGLLVSKPGDTRFGG